MEQNNAYDVIVIGSGPAGMDCALNLARGGKSVLLFEKEGIGGQIANSPRVENIPGVMEITGSEFASNFFDQIIERGAKFEFGEVTSISKEDNLIQVSTNSDSFFCKDLVIATGCSHKVLGLESETKYIGKGVSFCAVCDGAFFEGKEVVVIGDANTAVQYALYLSKICPKVTLVALFDKLFADNVLKERVKTTDNIEILYNYSTVEFVGDETLKGILFENTKNHEIISIPCEGAFVAIGQKPNNEIFSEYVDLDENGYIITDENMHTKTEHIYAIGDCRRKKYRQVTTAIGDATSIAFELTTK